jgi:uncharacterized protein
MLGAMLERYSWHRVAVSWLLPLLMAGANPSAAQTMPVPPPFEQLQADCTRPQYASDTLVCSDAELRAADAQVAELARALPTLAADAIWEDQASWLRRRSLCAFKTDHRVCLVAAHADRGAVLTASARAATQPIRCNGVLNGRTLASSTVIAGQALTIAENGRLVAVATPSGTAWQPWLAWRAAGNRIKLQPLGGTSITCRLHPTPR